MDDLKLNVDLINTIDAIKPVSLESVSYTEQLDRVEKTFKKAFECDGSNLILIIQTIKESDPSYKRDLLIQVLDHVIFESDNLISKILNQLISNKRGLLWKELANSLVALPDVIANCNILNKFIRFKADIYYEKLLNDLHMALKLYCDRNDKITTDEQNWFSLTILGRVSIISDLRHLVWEHFIHKVIKSEQSHFKSSIGNILTFPLNSENSMSAQYEIFIESLIVPIFYHLHPTRESGNLINELLVGQDILKNDSFEYIICNKLILQNNYNQSRHRQKVILFNIFSYLACLASKSFAGGQEKQTVSQPSSSSSTTSTTARLRETSLLVKTLVMIAQNWSNQTKILFRTLNHNEYITSAFLIAFRFALEYDEESLINCAESIESSIMQGFTVYLERASVELRNIAMCLGELLLPKLHTLLDATRTAQVKASRSELPEKLNFDILWEGHCLELKNLLYLDIDELFKGGWTEEDEAKSKNLTNKLVVVPKKEKTIVCDIDSSFEDLMNERSKQKQVGQPKKRLIESLDECEEDDLKPYDDGNDDVADTTRPGLGQDLSAPIYLRDCIDGLVENKNPHYVKLCLMKAGDLIDELSGEQQEAACTLSTDRQLSYIKSRRSTKAIRGGKANEISNDAITDNAIELAKILLYLEDQYNIEGFSGLRIRALISLAIVATEMVVKYLLDEFNGDNRNIRHQLDILQVLVSSAQNLSISRQSGTLQSQAATSVFCRRINDGRINGFAKYANLYFYGLIHRLKISNQPSIIVSDNRHWLNIEERQDDYYTATTTFISDMKKEKRNIMKTNIINYDFDVDSIGSIKREDNCNVVGGGGGVSGSKTTTTARLDDSYLLSRILFSISLIIKCLNQQPVACKLSNDLLDVLAAYRYHLDDGVRKSIINCLTLIRDSTPSVYLDEHLSVKIEKLFGPFLANECELIGRLRL